MEVRFDDVELIPAGIVRMVAAGPAEMPSGVALAVRAPHISAYRFDPSLADPIRAPRPGFWLVLCGVGVALLVGILAPTGRAVAWLLDHPVRTVGIAVAIVLVGTGAWMASRRMQAQAAIPGHDTFGGGARGFLGSTGRLPTILGRLRVGLDTRPLTSSLAVLDADLQGWVEADAAHVFDLVRIVVAPTPASGERVGAVLVRAQLDAPDDVAERPVIWSLWPKRLVATGSAERGTKLGTRLKLLDAEMSVSRSEDVERPLLIGTGEFSPEARWDITARGAGVDDLNLALVVRRAVGSAATCTVRAELLLDGGDGPLHYQALLPQGAGRLLFAPRG